MVDILPIVLFKFNLLPALDQHGPALMDKFVRHHLQFQIQVGIFWLHVIIICIHIHIDCRPFVFVMGRFLWGGGYWFLCPRLCNLDENFTHPTLSRPTLLLHSTTRAVLAFTLLRLYSVALLFFKRTAGLNSALEWPKIG